MILSKYFGVLFSDLQQAAPHGTAARYTQHQGARQQAGEKLQQAQKGLGSSTTPTPNHSLTVWEGLAQVRLPHLMTSLAAVSNTSTLPLGALTGM